MERVGGLSLIYLSIGWYLYLFFFLTTFSLFCCNEHSKFHIIIAYAYVTCIASMLGNHNNLVFIGIYCFTAQFRKVSADRSHEGQQSE